MRIITRPLWTTGTFLFIAAASAAAQSGLVDLAAVDESFHFDIRYATSNNFLHRRFYTQPRAFLQRPAAEALAQAADDLRVQGFGLLIYDAYRPLSVTRMFWDATPASLHAFVADPARGSKHNRGCAVDLSLYDLKTNRAVEMPSEYDEMTERAHPNYAGGIAAPRHRRDLLRQAMEKQGFTVDRGEWWHFDYKDWPSYPVLDIPFEEVDAHAR